MARQRPQEVQKLMDQLKKLVDVKQALIAQLSRAAQRLKHEVETLTKRINDLEGADSTDLPKQTSFERIKEFLFDVQNQPKTIREIMQATGIGRPSVTAVLYRTHADRFVGIQSAELQAKQWQLRGYGFSSLETKSDTPF